MRASMAGLILVACGLWLCACGDDDGGCKNRTEVCDGIDNNCNGLVDDGVNPRTCQTDCGTGTEECVNGQWVNCTASQPGVETCNGLDDDCDGCWDEQPGEACEPLEQPCSTACGTGTEECYMGQWRGCTAPDPGTEVCNGADDDCDGQTDEDLDVDADGDGHYSLDSCSQPNDDCNDSDAEVYPGHPEGPDYCDGVDNDCDREIDEDCECSPGPPPETKQCSTNVGACTIGQQTCQPDGTWGDCSGQTPETEECDGLDNDCDGLTDNVADPPPCELDQGVCEGAVRIRCEPCNYGDDYEQVEQTCDGLDNDCDGAADNNLPVDSYEDNETCGNQDPAVLPNVDEFEGGISVTKTLYKYEQDQPVRDVDWYEVTTVEGTHIGCDPTEDQVFTVWFLLALPQSADHAKWEMCVLPDDCNGTEYCTDETYWDAGSRAYGMGLTWTASLPFGGCGIDDTSDWEVVVRPIGSETITECNNYTLQIFFECVENCGI